MTLPSSFHIVLYLLPTVFRGDFRWIENPTDFEVGYTFVPLLRRPDKVDSPLSTPYNSMRTIVDDYHRENQTTQNHIVLRTLTLTISRLLIRECEDLLPFRF